MARNTKNAPNTNDLEEYITPPVIPVIRPLPRRAQGATVPPLPASQIAGPSKSPHIAPTHLPGTSPTQPRASHKRAAPEGRPSAPPRRPSISMPHRLQLAQPESVTVSPPNKRLRTLIPKSKQTETRPTGQATGSKARNSPLVSNSTSHSNAQVAIRFQRLDAAHGKPTVTQTKTHQQEDTYIPPCHTTASFDAEGSEEKLINTRAGEAQGESIVTDHQSTHSSGSAPDSMRQEDGADSLFKVRARGTSSQETRPDSFDVGIPPAVKELPQLELAVQGSTWKVSEWPREHCGILPPHVTPSSSSSTLQLHGFKSLLGRQMHFRRLTSLCGGNGTASLEVVCSLAGRFQGFGFPMDSLWVLKIFRNCDKEVTREFSESCLMQLERENAAYTRIAEASKVDKVGFNFIMMMEATIVVTSYPCLVLPLMSTDLGHFLDKSEGIIPRKDSRRMIAQMVVGLATLHSIGIIHSDVKPANVFLDARGNVKLGDFGLSHVTKSIESLSVSRCYDKLGHGTPGYIAPEKVAGIGGYSYPVDYWSVGWVLYEMLSGRKELINSLDNDSALLHWARKNKDHCKRKESFATENFDSKSLDLLCGLLDPKPETRMSLEAMLWHPFFMDDDGSYEFMDMETKARSRTEESVSQNWENLGPKIRYTSEPSDDTMYRWINPYGTYVSNAATLTY